MFIYLTVLSLLCLTASCQENVGGCLIDFVSFGMFLNQNDDSAAHPGLRVNPGTQLILKCYPTFSIEFTKPRPSCGLVVGSNLSRFNVTCHPRHLVLLYSGCEYPTSVDGGQVTIKTSSWFKGPSGDDFIKPGANVTLTCNPPYQPKEGNHIATCLQNGTLSQELGCTEVKCHKPVISNGSVFNYQNNKSISVQDIQTGFKVAFNCSHNFRPSSTSPSAECLSTGKWSNNFTCIECSEKAGWDIINAARVNHAEDINLIMKHCKPINVNHKDNHKWTALIWAAKFNHSDIVAILIGYRADVNAVTDDGTSALIFALKNNNTNTAKLLIAKGADVNRQNDYKAAPLLLAAKNGNSQLVKQLIDKDANPAVVDSQNTTVLMWAVKSGDLQTVNVTIAHYPDNINAVDAKDRTALMYASVLGFDGIVKLLLSHGADKAMIDIFGYSAYHWAETRDHNKTMALLRNPGASVTDDEDKRIP